MSSKKKNKKKASKVAKVEEDDFEEQFENDDDASISAEDCAELSRHNPDNCEIPTSCRLIVSTSKQLQKNAIELLDLFKNRCMLSIGDALIFYYEFLVKLDAQKKGLFLQNRILLIYLVYRCRDLEPALKRKQEKKENVLGHPFTEFFLSLAGSRYAERKVDPSAAEAYFASLLLSRRVSEVASLLAAEYISNFQSSSPSIDPISYVDVEDYYHACSLSWKEHVDDLRMPSIFFSENEESYSETENPNMLQLRLTEVGKRILTGNPPQVPPPFYVAPLPVCPIGVEMWSKTMLPESELEAVEGEEIKAPTSSETPSTSTVAGTDAELDIITKRILGGDLLLSPLQARKIVLHLAKATDDDPYLKQLLNITNKTLCKLIDVQARVADELILKGVQSDKTTISGITTSMQDLGFHSGCLKILLRVYKSVPDIPSQPLHDYLCFILQLCQTHFESNPNDNTLARYIRIFCMFVSALVQEDLFNAMDILTPLQQFLLNNRKYKEATNLYTLLQEHRAYKESIYEPLRR